MTPKAPKALHRSRNRARSLSSCITLAEVLERTYSLRWSSLKDGDKAYANGAAIIGFLCEGSASSAKGSLIEVLASAPEGAPNGQVGEQVGLVEPREAGALAQVAGRAKREPVPIERERSSERSEDPEGPVKHTVDTTTTTTTLVPDLRGPLLSAVNTAAINRARLRIGGPTLGDVTPAAINRARLRMRAGGLGPATINRKLAALRTMLGVAAEEGLIGALPVIRREVEPEGRSRFLTQEEQGQLEAAIGPAWDRLVTFLAETGLRVGEALRLKWGDIGYAPAGCAKSVLVRDTKSARPRTVPLTLKAQGSICADRTGHAGATPLGEGPFWALSQSSFNKAWSKALELLGWSDPDLVPHCLRHTCASRLIQRGVPLPVVKAWLGHSSIQTTMRYAHLDTGALDRAATLLESCSP